MACFEPATETRLLTWDVTALGPAQARQPFVRGQCEPDPSIAETWLQRARGRDCDAAAATGAGEVGSA